MATLLITGLSGFVTGRTGAPVVEAESLTFTDGVLSAVDEPGDADVVVDADGAVAIPGLIDSHAHVVFGDWTPRQSALGWIASSLHGGVTMMMSASEVHLPGRPSDREGVKALAIAANRAYTDYRPGGVKVMGGSVIVEPTLEVADFPWLAEQGVRLAKVGFGAFDSQSEAAPLVRAAQAAGMVVMNHTGGASIPGSSPVTIEDVLALGCDIIGHANGGTTALPDADLPRLFDAPGAIQLVQAGNLRSSLRIVEIGRERDLLERVVIATDTPTGTGVMPLGMIKTVAEISSLAAIPATDAIAMATGNNGLAMHREEGVLEVGRPGDAVLLHPPLGGAFEDPLTAIEHGDLPGISAVIVDGRLKTLRSRNSPSPSREARVVTGVAAV